MNKLVYLAFFLSFVMSLNAQKIITLQPDGEKGIDAFVNDLNPNTNYAKHVDVIAYNWTFSGQKGKGISYLKFDLSQLPANIIIKNAVLSLYYNSTSNSDGQAGENATNVFLVKSNWTESTITWSNQPDVDSTKKLVLVRSSTKTQDYDSIPFTDFVKYWYSNPTKNFGVQFALVKEIMFSSLKFCSSDHIDPIVRPKLVITYDYEPECVQLQPDASNGKDAFLDELNPTKNFGTSTDFITYDWTFNGKEGKGKSLIQFDLNQIPSNSVIKSSTLTLTHNPNSTNTAGQAGQNASTLYRITSSWNESDVTWNTVPSFDQFGKVALEKSVSATQNYDSIDLIQLTQFWTNNKTENYGILIDLDNPTLYSSLKFASSDHTNSVLRPKLKVCFERKALLENVAVENKISVYPNPATTHINVQFSKLDELQNFFINDISGKIVRKGKLNLQVDTIDISDLENGQYILRFENRVEHISFVKSN